LGPIWKGSEESVTSAGSTGSALAELDVLQDQRARLAFAG